MVSDSDLKRQAVELQKSLELEDAGLEAQRIYLELKQHKVRLLFIFSYLFSIYKTLLVRSIKEFT